MRMYPRLNPTARRSLPAATRKRLSASASSRGTPRPKGVPKVPLRLGDAAVGEVALHRDLRRAVAAEVVEVAAGGQILPTGVVVAEVEPGGGVEPAETEREPDAEETPEETPAATQRPGAPGVEPEIVKRIETVAAAYAYAATENQPRDERPDDAPAARFPGAARRTRRRARGP